MNKEYLIQNLKHWDWESYGKENKDLRYDSSSLFNHALRHGIKEGRTLKFDKNKNFLKQSENFDISSYLKYLNNNISICYACKNRSTNLIQSIKSIINSDIIDDIVVVDWNTTSTDLYKLLKKNFSTNFWKINYIKINNNVPWILSYAYNISLFHATNNKIIKSDCDYIFNGKCIKHLNELSLDNSFYSFSHEEAITENQKHLNGFFYLSKYMLKDASYFNQKILFYGYDDDDLKITLEKKGYKFQHLKIDDNELYHIEGNDSERVVNCIDETSINFFGYSISDIYVDALILYNKYLSETDGNNTKEKNILNLFTKQKQEYNYIEYSLNMENIVGYNNSCNYLYPTRTTICRYDIFEKMQEVNFWCGQYPITKYIKKYNITNIKDKINFFMINCSYISQQTQNKIGNNNLVISLYNETEISRAIELLYCLTQNLKNPYINIIHILLERDSDKETPYFILDCINILIKYHKNIKIIYISKRPTFNDLFDYCNNNINGIAMIANSDIVYDETLSKINIVDNDFIVLTRYNLYNNKFELIKIGKEPNIKAQDTWIFKSPMKYVINFPVNLGAMFSDSCLSYLLKRDTKYNVSNKALYIKSFHIQTEDSLSESITQDEKNQCWMEMYNLVNPETKNFIQAVTLETDSSKSKIIESDL